MKYIKPGDSYYGDNTDDIICLLGSCVGVVITDDDKIGITHGRNAREVYSQITNIIDNFETYDDILLLGGGSINFKDIGTSNINAAIKALDGCCYTNDTGTPCRIKIINGEIYVKQIHYES